MSMMCACFAEIPLPNEQARLDILKIHANPIAKHGEIGEITSTFSFTLVQGTFWRLNGS